METALATKSIINAAGRRLRGFFAAPEREEALQACVDAGVAGFLATAGDVEGGHLVDVLRQLFEAEDLSSDLGLALTPLLRGNLPDFDELEALFEDAGLDASTLQGFNVRDAFNAFVAGFADGIVASPVLREELNKRLLVQIRDELRKTAGVTGQTLQGNGNVTVNIDQVASDAVNIRSEIDWEAFYLRTLVAECDRLDLASIDESAGDVRVRLSDVFTTLLVEGSKAPISAVEMALSIPRLVILGRTGSGKSTLVNHIVVQLARQRLGQDINPKLSDWDKGNKLLPVRVILRHFAAWLPSDARPSAVLVWKYLRKQLQDSGCGEASRDVEYILRNDDGIMFFDGLNEVQEEDGERKRSLISKAIELFAKSLDRCRVVVTCRDDAYRLSGAWRLPDDVFSVSTLAPFSIEQVQVFTETWYRVLGPTRGWSEGRASAEAAHLTRAMEESSHLRSLAESPLLLTLMVQIHGRDGTLPQSRADLYERAIILLLALWQNRIVRDLRMEKTSIGDDHRVLELGIQVNDIRDVLEKIAFDAHERQEKENARFEGAADIPDYELLHALDEKLGSLDVARDVISYVQQRTGLLLATGLHVYRFPHRTFQEYLAARHLLKQADYDKILCDRVRRDLNWWREVFLLTAGAARETPRVVSDLVDYLIPRSPTNETPVTQQAAEEARLAAQALDETRFAERVHKEPVSRFGVTFEKIQSWLLASMSATGTVKAQERARCGTALAALGDPRPNVTSIDSMELCWVPAGSFWMGRETTEDEGPLHLNKEVDYDYWVARYPVTVSQYRQYVKDSDAEPASPQPLARGSNTPVGDVSWGEAQGFCRWLTHRWLARGFLLEGLEVRLPSEAEWEKAARGGVEIPAASIVRTPDDYRNIPHSRALTANSVPLRVYPWPDDTVENLRNGSDEEIGSFSPVGCFPNSASVYGCEEMIGNVWEWTRSLYKDASNIYKYPYTWRDGREDPEADSPFPVLRGGSFETDSEHLNLTHRFRREATWRGTSGFRVVIAPARDAMFREFSELVTWGASLLKQCRADQAEVVSTKSFGAGRWLLRLTLPCKIQEDYGTSREALVLAIEGKLQKKDLSYAQDEIWRQDANVDLDLLIVAEDRPNLDERLETMCPYGAQWVAWSPVDGKFPSLIDVFRRYLPAQDVFEVRHAVRGNQVVGREKVITDLSRRVLQGQAVGVFGLRKMGKTTAVRAVTDRLDPLSARLSALPGRSAVDDQVSTEIRARVVWLDAGHVQGERTLDQVALLLCRDLEQRLQFEELLPAETPPHECGLEKFRKLLESALTHARIPYVLVIDEYDFLFEGSDGEPAIPGLEKLFQMLRAFAQETSRLALVGIGRDPTFFNDPEMGGRTNPMLGWFAPRWLGPLPEAEAEILLTRLGRRVGLDVGPQTCREALRWTGGHPFLHRAFGSALLKQARHAEPGVSPVATDPLHDAALDIFLDSHDVVTICREVGHLLSSRYAEAYEMLVEIAHSEDMEPGGSMSLADLWRRPAVRTLRDFGLLLGTPQAAWMPEVIRWYLRVYRAEERIRA